MVRSPLPGGTGEGRAQAAGGGPFGMPGFRDLGLRLLEAGYEPLPLRRATKVPAVPRWSRVMIDAAQVEHWARDHPDGGVGLRSGRLVGLDIDLQDPDLAWSVADLASRRLGATLMRVGQWPKRLLLYRTLEPFAKMKAGAVEILGQGQQFAAFGIHPATGLPYSWPEGETPLDVPLDDLPLLDRDALEGFLVEATALQPATGSSRTAQGAQGGGGRDGASGKPVRDADGRVIDGRDGWMAILAYHALHDALEAGEDLDAPSLAARVWERFIATADVARPGAHGPWTAADAARKLADKLRQHRAGTLAPRQREEVEPDYAVPGMTATEAREGIDGALSGFCDRTFDWWAAGRPEAAPRLALRATVGLGKSSLARRHLLELQRRLREAGQPGRMLVLVASHDLAEEAAASWGDLGARVAVHRGYERVVGAVPVCRNPGDVRAAVAARLDVHESACARGDRRCRSFDGCLKQRNRSEVAAADVIIAAYDAMFQRFHGGETDLALVMVDEGCWQRAWSPGIPLGLDSLAFVPPARGLVGKIAWAAWAADLQVHREALLAAVDRLGDRSEPVVLDLDPDLCRTAAQLERRALPDPLLVPGLGPDLQARARAQAAESAAIHQRADLWLAIAAGRPVLIENRTIRAPIVRAMHATFAGLPCLHLDATHRPDLARPVLGEMAGVTVEAAAPHMHLTLVTGRFGKSRLSEGLSEDLGRGMDGGMGGGMGGPAREGAGGECPRPGSLLAACVDYVRWEARQGGETLVVTHKQIEPAFAGLPGVATGHFNAIAGLDRFRDIRRLIVVGRAQPRDSDLPPMAAALFGVALTGSYAPVPTGVRLRDGTSRTLVCQRHGDGRGELLRAAICDDELLQAIGRGRGVNRRADNPLDVHVLAAVALPLVHDRVRDWDLCRPDALQRMLLSGIAVDSPTDAFALYPDLFGSLDQARKLFQRGGFKGQTPYKIHKAMSLKSALYRRPGAGRSWQRALWIEGTADSARAWLEARLGAFDGWLPD